MLFLPSTLENALPLCIHFMNDQILCMLGREIEAALKEPYSDPWLPDLTDLLAEWGWKALHCSTGITATDYGTVRVLAGRAKAPRQAGVCLPILVRTDKSTHKIAIEFLPEDWLGPYQDLGLTFYTPDEFANSAVFECLQDAIDTLAKVPTLQKTVATLVRACHILKPEDDDYDVSHSEPSVPFSIFVSVPQKRRMTDDLRVAESLVHETMHLQLTLIERLQPLVHMSNQTYFSPWKGAHRSPQGVLHALYVFRVLDRFFERLLTFPEWPATSIEHLQNRRCEITQQIRDIKTFQDCPALTELGTHLVRKLIFN